MRRIIQIKKPPVVPAPFAVIKPQQGQCDQGQGLGLQAEKRQIEQSCRSQLFGTGTVEPIQQQDQQYPVSSIVTAEQFSSQCRCQCQEPTLDAVLIAHSARSPSASVKYTFRCPHSIPP